MTLREMLFCRELSILAKAATMLTGSCAIAVSDICATSWDVDASLSAKDRPISLFLPRDRVEQTQDEPFFNDPVTDVPRSKDDKLNVKLLVNFAPQNAVSAALQRSDTDALVSIMKTIQRDPRVTRVSLVAFNINEGQILYRQEFADQIDFAALGKALNQIKLGTVNVQKLGQKHSETDFLENLITNEVRPSTQTDAVIFAGPKAMLDANVPDDDLRRIGGIECPVFYMNYALNPQATPWKDSISHAIRTFRGTEYTISRPRDMWFFHRRNVQPGLSVPRKSAPLQLWSPADLAKTFCDLAFIRLFHS